MKHALVVLAALCAAVSAHAQSIDATLDSIIKDSKSNFEQLTALDKKDKDLKNSNDAQVFSTNAANKMEKEIKDAAGPLQMEANAADAMRARLLAMGCPEGGGEVPLELAQRCNPPIAEHKAKVASILRRAQELKNKAKTIATLRENITKTTLKNVEQQKRNNEERAKLQAQKLEIQTRAVIAGLKNKAAAAQACASLPAAEAACCQKVVFDGADPKTCGVGLLCQAFEKAGMFGTGVVICRVSN